MIIISHRGNIKGPISTTENHESSINKCIQNNIQIEIDLWGISGELFLGHDFPEHPIEKTFLMNNKEYLWIHCKNIDAADFCCTNNLSWFGHDSDEYVSVSGRNIIWRHPFSKCKITEKSIAVLPELSRLTVEDFNTMLGVCTDYPEIYLHSNMDIIEKLYIPVYERMEYNHRKKLQNTSNKYDSNISCNNDLRRCLAIWSWLNDSNMNEDFHLLLDELKFSNKWISYIFDRNHEFGRIHFTLLQCFGFNDEHVDLFDMSYKEEILSHYLNISFYIRWIKIICIDSGVIMLGIPSIDINKIRNNLVNQYKFREPYLNNIVHATILRFNQVLTKDELKLLQDKIKIFSNFGISYINQFNFGKASLLMNEIDL